MIHFVGAGCGAADLITVRGKGLLEAADVIIYAGSLVNPALLDYRKETCRVYDSARMTLEEVLSIMFEAEAAQTFAAYQRVLFDPAAGRYRDGVGTGHAASVEAHLQRRLLYLVQSQHVLGSPARYAREIYKSYELFRFAVPAQA